MSFKHKDQHSQSKKIVYSVYLFFKNLSESKKIDANFFRKTQDITNEACGVSKRSIQRICVKNNDELPETGPSFSFPRKSYKGKICLRVG